MNQSESQNHTPVGGNSTCNDDRRQYGRVSDTISVALNADLNLELLELATSEMPDTQLREELGRLAVRMTNGTGAARVVCDADGHWSLVRDEQSGRLPISADFSEWLSKRCPESVQRGVVSYERPTCLAGGTVVIVPLLEFGCPPEIFLLLLEPKSDVAQALLVVQRIAGVLKKQLKSQFATQSTWKLNSLAALVELVTNIEAASDGQAGRACVANEMARHLGCPYVAVAGLRNDVVGSLEISGARTIDPRSNTYHDFQQALEETLLRDSIGLWPPSDDSNHLLLAHRQLARGLQCEAILSQPLITIDGRRIGCWLFAGPRELVHSERMQRFVRTAACRVAGALNVLQRTELPRTIRFIQATPKVLRKRRIQVFLAIVALVCCILAFPVPYRVRAYCTLSPAEKRFAVVPFDGTIARGFVRPGDTIQAGDLLAEMDDRTLNIQLAGVAAEHLKAMRKQSVELANHNISDFQIAKLEAERLAAEEEFLRFRKEHLQITSPMTGIILSGSTDRAEAAAVRQGQVLFEIGSLDLRRIEVEIPATEIACVNVGQPVTVWVEGLESTAIYGTIERIHSQAELRGGQLVFIAEVPFELASIRDQAHGGEKAIPYQPGMRGSARIDGDRHSLAWNLFRRPYEVLKSYLAW
ncbi:MAG: efflux RND transporter periplasmic adaptor subunit [Pirellula sp.]